MKNILFYSFLLLFSIVSCKKEPEVNALISGLDPSVKLPNTDTTGALAYIQGFIDGEPFSVVHNKDDFKMYDAASGTFGLDYDKKWFEGIVGTSWRSTLWYFKQPESSEKYWEMRFKLPGFSSKKTENDFKEFKKKYTTPTTFTNIGQEVNTGIEEFNLEIWRNDIFDGKWNKYGVTTFTGNTEETKTLQKNSFFKLVSVKYIDYIPNTNYRYEMVYEFDVKLRSGAKTLHLTKGRMKTWLVRIKP
jgi:hypothetical protein